MAITKKFKVTFDLTLKLDSEVEEAMGELIRELAKRAGSGEKLGFKEREMLVQALTRGPDGVAAFIVRSQVREGIKEMFEELGDKDLFKVSPATVREVF